jgi:O-methyltransferase
MPDIKKPINAVLNPLGYSLIKNRNYRMSVGNFAYDKVLPHANYSPWLNHTSFQSVFQKIKSNTLVDVFRCFELWQLVEQCEKNSTPGAYIEIGTWRGGTAGIIGSQLKALNSANTLYVADTFTGVVKTSAADSAYSGGEHSDTSRSLVEELLFKTLSLKNIEILEGIFPDDTQHLIASDTAFKFCHIDVDVYQSAIDIVNWIWPKLHIGGMIVFDDYGFHTCDGIARYVEEHRNDTDKLVFHNLNGHAVFVKLS